MRKFFAVLFIVYSLGALAQTTTVTFEKKEIDLGIIKEVDGPKVVVFVFKNTGKYPMSLRNVVSPCSCTVPRWSKDTIYPGKTGSIEARFDPAGREGSFVKAITVLMNNTTEEFDALTIKGIVDPKERPVAMKYPSQIGNLRMETDHLSFGDIKNNSKDTVEMKIYNDGFSTINFLKVDGPEYVTYEYPSELRPKTEGILRAIFDGSKTKELGQQFFKVTITTDDKDNPYKYLYNTGNILNYFPPMSRKDSLMAPRAKYDKTHHNWGTIMQGEMMTVNFMITNVGKSDLEIKQTKASCGCTASNPLKTLLKKGETTRIEVRYDSKGKSGHENKAVYVFTNDPFNPVVVLTIAGEVEVPTTK
jgi:hypothetical protein